MRIDCVWGGSLLEMGFEQVLATGSQLERRDWNPEDILSAASAFSIKNEHIAELEKEFAANS